MTTRTQLDAWLASGAITAGQHATIDRLIRRDRLSAFVELNVLLYLGVLSLAGGLAWTASVYSERWGDVAILVPTTALFVGCLYYCFVRAAPYTSVLSPVADPTLDYVLYLACLVFAVELSYVEYRFHLLQSQWDNYLLASAFLYFWLAYRFDNRFVLSLAIATLGGWFGVRFSQWRVQVDESVRLVALVSAALVGAAGLSMHRARIKKHFLETYLHVATNVMLTTLVSGTMARTSRALWLGGLIVAASAAVLGGVRFRRFVFVVYGIGYGYVGISSEVLRRVHSLSAGLAYVVVSASIVVAALVVLSRRFGRE